MAEQIIIEPPHSAEAERSILGCILMDNLLEADDRVIDSCQTNGIVEETFYDSRNRVIYHEILELKRSDAPVNATSLLVALKSKNLLEAAGGEAYFCALTESAPVTSTADHFISVLRDKHMRRQILAKMKDVNDHCFDERRYNDANEILGYAEKSFLEIATNKGQMVEWKSAVGASFDKLLKMFNMKGRQLDGLHTGLKYLDERLQGLKKSEMIVIAARPSVGKTSLAMNIAESVALGRDMNNQPIVDGEERGKRRPVLIFSLEMPTEALTQRMLAGRANVNMWEVNRGLVPEKTRQTLIQNISTAASELAGAPLYVDDTAGLDIMDLRARARRAKKKHGIELIVIDYLQLCTCREAQRQGSRQIEVSMISQHVKAMAKELKVPVIVLSQLSRNNEQRGDKQEKPKLSDLRDSGAIEQDADVVFLLRRPSRTKSDPESNDEQLAIIDVAKNRNGETGEVRVNFIRQFTRFQDREPESNRENFQSSEPADQQVMYQQTSIDDLTS